MAKNEWGLKKLHFFRASNEDAEVSDVPQPVPHDVTEFVQPFSSSLNDWPALNFKFIDQVWMTFLETSKTFLNQISIEYF